MKRFKNILLVHPCDRRTLDRAAALAHSNRARLTVLKAAPEVVGASLVPAPGSPPLDIQALVVEDCQSRLEQLVAPLKQDGLRVSTAVFVGTPFLGIIRDVIRHRRDLVIITAEGKGGLGERLFGSTSLHLMRKCPCPVWVMKPSRRRRFARILAAVDPDSTEETRVPLGALIAQLAASLAKQDGAELHVVHAWTVFGETILRGRARVSEAEIREFVRREADRHRRMLDALLATHTDGTAEVHIVKGNADWVIPRIAKVKRIDLLVMGTVCRTGISGFLIGNTAEKVLADVDCSVLTVKPEGFQSPVKLV
jgi:nucleotide-binding universal stress UspA family protein